jgi:hypothetical protein
MVDRRLDAVTARALRLALAPDFDLEEAAGELLAAAGGSWPLLNAVLIRFDRALSLRWSEVEARASDAVRLALESTAGSPLRSAV